MQISWQIILILIYSVANLLFSLSYGWSHPQSPLPAQSAYLTVGLLGIFVSGALSLQHIENPDARKAYLRPEKERLDLTSVTGVEGWMSLSSLTSYPFRGDMILHPKRVLTAHCSNQIASFLWDLGTSRIHHDVPSKSNTTEILLVVGRFVFLSMCKFRTRMWNRSQGSDFQSETVGNALEAECYSEASSAAFISLFPISITSLIYRAGDGDRTRDVQLGKMDLD
jgi:hypothetical protein